MVRLQQALPCLTLHWVSGSMTRSCMPHAAEALLRPEQRVQKRLKQRLQGHMTCDVCMYPFIVNVAG